VCTLYQRILKSKKVNLKTKVQLIKQYRLLNQTELQRNSNIKIKELRKMIRRQIKIRQLPQKGCTLGFKRYLAIRKRIAIPLK